MDLFFKHFAISNTIFLVKVLRPSRLVFSMQLLNIWDVKAEKTFV